MAHAGGSEDPPLRVLLRGRSKRRPYRVSYTAGVVAHAGGSEDPPLRRPGGTLQQCAESLPGLGIGWNPVVPAERFPDVGATLDAEEAQFANVVVTPVDRVVDADLGLVQLCPLPEVEEAFDVLRVAGHEVLDELFKVGTGLVEALGATMMALPHADHDGDGCKDGAELGSDETTGGQRDPTNPNDYYDVNGDRIIDLSNDIFEVIQHYAPTGSEPAYDVAFDRGPTAGPNVWNMTAPDGVIDLSNDIFGVIQQYFHDCR